MSNVPLDIWMFHHQISKSQNFLPPQKETQFKSWERMNIKLVLPLLTLSSTRLTMAMRGVKKLVICRRALIAFPCK